MRVRFDAQHHVQVSWLAAAEARLSLAADPDLRPGVDAGRNLDRQALGLLDTALAAALCARVLDQAARPAACGTRGRRDDLTEDGLCLSADLARPATARARLVACSRFGPAARAAVAGQKASHVDLLLDAGERLFEGDRQVVTEVIAAVRTLAPRP